MYPKLLRFIGEVHPLCDVNAGTIALPKVRTKDFKLAETFGHSNCRYLDQGLLSKVS